MRPTYYIYQATHVLKIDKPNFPIDIMFHDDELIIVPENQEFSYSEEDKKEFSDENGNLEWEKFKVWLLKHYKPIQ